MVNDVVGRIAEAVPFMTGQYRDALAKKTAFFSIDTAAAVAGSPAAAPSESQSSGPRQVFATLPASIQADPEPEFAPTFRPATGTDGFITWNLNSNYFATVETADWIAKKYGTGEVVEIPFGGSGGLFAASANEYHVKLNDGRLVNAGILAGYYQRNPPERFPGLADKLIRRQLGLA